MKVKKIAAVLLAITLLAFTACTKQEKEESGKLKVAVSIVPEETFVKAVCGDLADVVLMIPAGSDPESYEPTPQQMTEFSGASVYFSIGVPAEKSGILKVVPKETEIVSLNDAVSEVYPDLKIGEERDPHIWLSPKRAVVMVNAIAEKMCELDENNSAIYRANADKYIAKINAADERMKSALSGAANKKLLVYHPAFGYLADDYGLTMYALEKEGKEATPKQLAEMIELAKSENIKVIFYQAEVTGKQAETFANEIGGKAVMLAPLAADYTDNIIRMADAISGEMK